MQVANSLVKIAKLNAMEIGIQLGPSDADVGFAAAATLTKAYKEEETKSATSLSSRKSVVQCLQLLLPTYRKKA